MCRFLAREFGSPRLKRDQKLPPMERRENVRANKKPYKAHPDDERNNPIGHTGL